jgi:hypothetical protein
MTIVKVGEVVMSGVSIIVNMETAGASEEQSTTTLPTSHEEITAAGTQDVLGSKMVLDHKLTAAVMAAVIAIVIGIAS